MSSKPLLTSLLLTLAILLLPVAGARAQSVSSFLSLVEIQFGGLVSSVVPCLCTGGIQVNFTPLYTGASRGPFFGGIIYRPPGTELFALMRPAVPGTYEIGSFVPGGVCLVPCGDACCPVFPLAIGTMRKVGTGALGF